jgi:hypothetical protein
MKANALEKIYLQVCGDCPQTDCDNCKFEDLEDNVTWCKDKIFDKDVEYIRTDFFIEKAEEYIYKQLNEGCIECGDIVQFIGGMKNYIKGE